MTNLYLHIHGIWLSRCSLSQTDRHQANISTHVANWGLFCMSPDSSNATLKYLHAWISECNCDSIAKLMSYSVCQQCGGTVGLQIPFFSVFSSVVFRRQDFNNITEAFINKLPFIVISLCNVQSQLVRCKRYGLWMLCTFLEQPCLLFCLTFQRDFLGSSFGKILDDVSMEWAEVALKIWRLEMR